MQTCNAVIHSYRTPQSYQETDSFRKPKVALYVRLSDEDIDKENPADDSESIKNQRSMLIQYVNNQEWEIYDIYCDDDFSGADQSIIRPDFTRMIQDCEKRKIDIVLCKHQSRFSRDIEVVEKYINGKFLEWNVRFVSILDHADTSVKANKKARQINGLINEWYVEDLSENIRATLKHKKEKGEYTGSFAPYGYLLSQEDKHKLIIDEKAAPVVRQIFELFLSGTGYSKIAEYLSEKQIPTPLKHKMLLGSSFHCGNNKFANKHWNRDTVRKILMNEVYVGNLVQGKYENISYKNKKQRPVSPENYIIVPNTHEPIIDIDTWNRTKLIFQERKKRTSYRTGEIHLFSRKVYCDCCKCSMARNNGYTKNHMFSYVRCRTQHSSPTACNNKKQLRYDYLETLVLAEINKVIDTYKNKVSLEQGLEAQISKLNTSTQTIEDKRQEKIQLELLLNKKKNTLKSLYQDKEDEIITREEFVLLKSEWTEEIKSLTNKVLMITESIEKLEEVSSKSQTTEELIKKYDTIKKLDHNILCTFINKIYIGLYNEENNTREIKIEWNI